jgi:hypothetical protein
MPARNLEQEPVLATAIAFVIAVVLLVPGCRRSVAPLAGGASSKLELARGVAVAFGKADVPALHALTLSEQEFRDHVWPELPAARPERNLPFSFVWGDLHQKSEASLSRTLDVARGRSLKVVSVQQLGATTRYQTYVVHRQTQLTIDGGDGRVEQIRLFGSILEKDGRFKVFSYVTD